MKNLMVKFSSKCVGLSQRLAMAGDTGLASSPLWNISENLP